MVRRVAPSPLAIPVCPLLLQVPSTLLIESIALNLALSPSVRANGKVEAHLIPTLNLGISALGDVAEATVFLNLDASATATLNLEAKLPGAAATIGRRDELEARQQEASFGGCFDVKAGFSVNAGADASFFAVFDTGTSVTLFEKEFELFQVCFIPAVLSSTNHIFPRNASVAVQRGERLLHTGLHPVCSARLWLWMSLGARTSWV